MKINGNINRNPGTGRRSIEGKSTLGVLAFLAITYFGVSYGINTVKDFQSSQLTDTKLREIAQRVVFVADTAEQAGVDLIVDGDIVATVDRVSKGGTATYGEFSGQYFGMPELEGKAKDRVARHLQLHYDRLTVKQFDSFASTNVVTD